MNIVLIKTKEIQLVLKKPQSATVNNVEIESSDHLTQSRGANRSVNRQYRGNHTHRSGSIVVVEPLYHVYLRSFHFLTFLYEQIPDTVQDQALEFETTIPYTPVSEAVQSATATFQKDALENIPKSQIQPNSKRTSKNTEKGILHRMPKNRTNEMMNTTFQHRSFPKSSTRPYC